MSTHSKIDFSLTKKKQFKVRVKITNILLETTNTEKDHIIILSKIDTPKKDTILQPVNIPNKIIYTR